MRRPVAEMVEVNLKLPRGNAGYWKIICELDDAGEWTISMVEQRSNVVRDSIRDFVRRLVKGGFAAKVGTAPQTGSGKSPSTTYRLLRKPLQVPRLDRAGKELPELQRETLWRAIKMAGTFDAAELSRLTETVSHQRAYRYLVALLGAGVIAQIDPGRPLRSSRFRLAKNLGGNSPVVTHAMVVFDPNSGKVLGEPSLVEVTP